MTREQGLSYDMVTTFLQDEIGYLWIGTLNGLNRYDGADFKIYRSDPGDASTISGNHVTDCLQCENGSLFVGTFQNGLNHYSYDNDCFTRIPPEPQNPEGYAGDYIVKFIRDSKNRIWMGTDRGLYRVFENPLRFKRCAVVCPNLSVLADQSVTALTEDSKGNIWFGVTGLGEDTDGIVRYNPENETTMWYGGASVICLDADRNDILWGGTWGDGVVRFDPRKGVFEFLADLAENHRDQYGRITKDVTIDRDGIVWIANWEKGLSRIDSHTRSYERIEAKPWISSGLSDNSLNCLYQDREGTVWIGTLHHGVNLYNPSKFQFKHYTHDPSDPESLNEFFCYALLEDREGVLWAGVQGGGLNRFDPRTEKFKSFQQNRNDPYTSGLDTIVSLEEDDRGTLWVGSHLNGLYSFDRKTERFTKFELSAPEVGEAQIIRAIHCDRNGRLWVGEEGRGLFEIDLETKKFQHYSDRADSKYRLSISQIRTIREDRSGRLWIGTYTGGINTIDPTSESVRVFRHDELDPDSLRSDSVVDIAIDEMDRVWVGTAAGLDIYDASAEKFVHCDAVNEYVCGIEAEESDHLWISTMNGLIHFDAVSKRIIKRYMPEDGVQDYAFHDRTHCRGKDGLLYFGGSNGFNQFDPSWFHQPSSLSLMPVVVTKVVTDRSVYNYPNPQDFSLTLPYGKANIAFQYAGLSFINPRRNHLEYQLQGYDEGWTPGDESFTARYTNLPPGDFVFRVIGANAQGVWNRKGVKIFVTVTPPFWHSSWFIALSVVLTAALIFSFHRLRVAYINRKTRLLEILVEKRTQELKNSQERIFHLQKLEAIGRLSSGLAHNINNLLTGFLGNLFLLKRHSGPKVFPQIKSMEETAERVSDLVKNMMKFSQEVAVERHLIDVAKIAADVYRLMQETFDSRIQIGFEVQGEIPAILADSLSLHSAIMNVCINAQEAVLAVMNGGDYPERRSDSFFIETTVRVITSSSAPDKAIRQNRGKCDRYVVVEVCDNGIGIEPDRSDLIFEPFYTTKKTVGTGLGLASAFGSVSLFGGTIDFESTRGEGSTFRIFLPVGE